MNTCATPAGCWGTPSSICTRQGLLCQLQKATADPTKQPWVAADYVPLERRSAVALPTCAPGNFWKLGDHRPAALQAQANALGTARNPLLAYREGFDADAEREGFDCDQGQCQGDLPHAPTPTGDQLRAGYVTLIVLSVLLFLGFLFAVGALVGMSCSGNARGRGKAAG